MLFDTNPIISLIANFIVYYGGLTKKRSLATHIIVLSTFIMLVFGFLAQLNRLGVFNTTIHYLLSLSFIIPIFYLFKGSAGQKIFLFFMSWGVSSFLRTICNWVSFWLEPGFMSAVVRYGFMPCCYIVLLPLYFKYWRVRIREMLSLFEKSRPVYAALPPLSFGLFVVLFGPNTKPGSLYWFMLMMLFECLVILMYYILFSHFFNVLSKQKAENDLENAERQLALQMRYYGEVEKGIETQGKLLHDTRHHFVAIASLAKTGELLAIERYVGQLLDSYGKSSIRRYCENSVANSIIGGYIDIAESHGIAVSADLDLPQIISIDEVELCTLFGNTMENAIEACRRIPESSALYTDRRIKIKSKAHNGCLVIRIENSYQNIHLNDEGLLNSSKGAAGGIGLESVKTVVERYRGCLSCKPHEGSFIVSAVLYPRLPAMASAFTT